MKGNKFFLFVLALALILLAGCQNTPATPTTTEPVVTEPPVEQLTMVVTEDTIGTLEQYPHLKILDLTGSTCYEAIAKYMQKHPKVEVTYTVQLGTAAVGNRETALTLTPGTCAYTTLAENLKYLPKLENVSLPRTTYTPKEIVALQGLYPDVSFDYSLIFLGQELNAETTELNFSVLEQKRVAEAAEKVSLFPGIEKIELMDSNGQSTLSIGDVKLLQEAAPNAVVHYSFQLFGKTVATTDERIEFAHEEIGNAGEEELRGALDILQNCKYLLLDDCGFDSEVLAKVRQDYPDTEVVWRIHIRNLNWLTDTDTIRAVDHLDNTSSEILKYCTKVKYMDIGENPELTDIGFMSHMPELEILILSGCPVTDLTPLADHTKLIFLEMAYCEHLKDIEPLASCTALANVNLSYTKVVDISWLKELPLEQLYAVGTKIPKTLFAAISGRHPECAVRYDGTQAYGTGWRFKINGAYTEIYQRVREVFALDEVDRQIAAANND